MGKFAFRSASPEELKKVRDATHDYIDKRIADGRAKIFSYASGPNCRKNLPREEVPIHKVVATQDYLDPNIVDKYVKQKKNVAPVVTKMKGEYFISNGHHRIEAAARRGNQTVKAHVMDTDEDNTQ